MFFRVEETALEYLVFEETPPPDQALNKREEEKRKIQARGSGLVNSIHKVMELMLEAVWPLVTLVRMDHPEEGDDYSDRHCRNQTSLRGVYCWNPTLRELPGEGLGIGSSEKTWWEVNSVISPQGLFSG
jgi:hypothetical protein